MRHFNFRSSVETLSPPVGHPTLYSLGAPLSKPAPGGSSAEGAPAEWHWDQVVGAVARQIGGTDSDGDAAGATYFTLWAEMASRALWHGINDVKVAP